MSVLTVRVIHAMAVSRQSTDGALRPELMQCKLHEDNLKTSPRRVKAQFTQQVIFIFPKANRFSGPRNISAM